MQCVMWRGKDLKSVAANFLDASTKRVIKAAEAVIRLMRANDLIGYA